VAIQSGENAALIRGAQGYTFPKITGIGRNQRCVTLRSASLLDLFPACDLMPVLPNSLVRCCKGIERFAERATGAAGPVLICLGVTLISIGVVSFCA